jgi:CDGSH-type Zn-finger protein/uncharacterized Fe-S cluster protein YjdI
VNALPSTADVPVPSRELLLHRLYEAAELEHNLMCTYLYAMFSLKSDPADGLGGVEAAAVARWRKAILDVAVAEMGHLVAIWNITAGLGGTPRFGRTNFPLDPGLLPAGVVVRLAPFDLATLQHFVHLERPAGSEEPDGEGFAYERNYRREIAAPRLVPMPNDYATVGEFYQLLDASLRAFVGSVGESAAFCGDKALQLAATDVSLTAARPVACLKTASSALDAIIVEGEGARADTPDSHFQRFVAVRTEYRGLLASNAAFRPAFPAATNPVLRRPPRPEGRVWIEDETAAATVDLGNACYQLMLRLLGHAYSTPSGSDEKALSVDTAIALMRATTSLGEAAARLPAGPSNPNCHAGLSFTALRDSAPLPAGAGARTFAIERAQELADAAARLARAPVAGPVRSRLESAGRQLAALAARVARGFANAPARPVATPVPAPAAPTAAGGDEVRTIDGDVERVEGRALTLEFEAKRCIHARFCVTGAPKVFLANVQGPWIHPDAMDTERLVDIAHACPSGAIQYRRKDGRPDEGLPPVNLASVREAGPYAFRGELVLDGARIGTRATLCRCGASKNKPFCDGSHHDAGFAASGEPPSTQTDMLPVRDGPLRVDPEVDGPLSVRGNLEITSGTGRVVARVTTARLCRCGGSGTKPFCDGTHAKIGFRSG